MTLPSELVTGLPEVDAQHAAILAEVERLREASPDGVWVSMAFLKQHAKAHISSEEMLMDAAGYPGAAAHRAEHQQLIATLGVLDERLQREGVTERNVALVIEEVEQWVANHILGSDRQLALFLSGRS